MENTPIGEKKMLKNISMVLCLCFTLIIGLTIPSQGLNAAGGDFSGTGGFSGTVLKTHMVGEAPKFILAEFYGATKNDAGSGIFDNMSFNCAFSIEVPKMPSTEGSGYCTFTDKDGDTVTFRAIAKGTLGVGSDATYKFVNGTGKYDGITGRGTYQTTNVKAAAPGTFQGFVAFQGNYKTP